jgi:hypothetical protein
MNRSAALQPRWIATACVLLVFATTLIFYWPDVPFVGHNAAVNVPPLASSFRPANHGLVKPVGVPVIGLIFFGRRDRVEVLRCYLERNLVTNGGWLDEIQWVRNTHDEKDLAYLRDDILPSNPLYTEIDISEMPGSDQQDPAYENAWTKLRRGAIYIKIDDDVVFIGEDTIPRMVDLRVKDPSIFTVSANVINSPLMGWVHYHGGAMHPYLPEFPVDKPHHIPKLESTPWAYTSHPNWTGDADWGFYADDAVPEHYHRWLRMTESGDSLPSSTAALMQRTPITKIQYDTWGTGLRSWSIAAQEHYSFLENLHDDPSLDIYKLSKIWTTDYERLSINMIAVLSDDILDNMPMTGVVDGKENTPIADEEWLTVVMPRKLGRQVVVETDALVVHFSFRTQSGLFRTDLLGRYADFARREVCIGRSERT